MEKSGLEMFPFQFKNEKAMKSLQVRTEIFMYLYYDHNNYNYNNITMLVCFVLTRVPVLSIPKICQHSDVQGVVYWL